MCCCDLQIFSIRAFYRCACRSLQLCKVLSNSWRLQHAHLQNALMLKVFQEKSHSISLQLYCEQDCFHAEYAAKIENARCRLQLSNATKQLIKQVAVIQCKVALQIVDSNLLRTACT